MISGFSELSRFPTVLAAAFGILAATGLPLPAAYDSPNFDTDLFDTDALSLNGNAREEVVNALAALAINYPEDIRVDDDLREKALALALSIDPLDGTARSAHNALLKGRKLKPVDFFSSLSSISKSLWRHGAALAAPEAEPEDRKLAPYLMEIALILQSGPENDQIWLFGHSTRFKPVEWEPLVKLQGSAHESNRHAQRLLREAENLRQKGASRPRPGPGKRPPGNNGEVAKIQIARPSIRFAAHDPASGAIPGEATLDIRKPNADERSLYGLFLGADSGDRDSFNLKLVWDRDGPTISGFDTAEKIVRATHARWPENLIGEYTFNAAGPNKPSQVDLALPAAILLESAFSGAAIPPDLAISGSLGEDGEVSLPGKASGLARAAGIGGGAVVKILLMPSEAKAGLTDAVTGGDLTVLVRPQVIAFNSYGEAKSLALDARPENLIKAMQMFEEIQNLTSQGMSLDEIARNPAVQERLRSISDLWPDHLSARIMLAYGTQPADMRLSREGSVGRIDAAVNPVAKHYTDSVFGGGSVVGAAKKLVDQARTTLRDLRPKVHADAQSCLASAERTIEAFDEYFKQPNKSSSRAAELRTELQEAINELNAARTELGAAENLSL